MKTIVVTGCNKGIGLGIVERLMEEQYKIVMACRNLELAQKSKLNLLERNP